MKYTKGPWRLSETPKDAIFNRYLLTGPGNEIIATIHAPIAPVELPESEVEANARLISSAPDLLEACVVAEGLISKRDSHAEIDISEVLGILRGAIDKATGD